jgi:hypothetical protein
MSTGIWPPTATATPTELLAGLSPNERLLGYDAILETLIGELGTATTACLRSSRPTRSGRVPSVLAVLDDRLVEYWLSGTAVQRAEVRRPGPG